ncbi:MAG: hypothetical protein UH078_10415, partial [Macrococcus canis]|uniref:hypothetical protein n=1 Tax=Macrococcoides canis TaxID=1855823 RepID=UPI002E775525
ANRTKVIKGANTNRPRIRPNNHEITSIPTIVINKKLGISVKLISPSTNITSLTYRLFFTFTLYPK